MRRFTDEESILISSTFGFSIRAKFLEITESEEMTNRNEIQFYQYLDKVEALFSKFEMPKSSLAKESLDLLLFIIERYRTAMERMAKIEDSK